MNRHIESVHKGKKPFKCNICHYTCSLKHNLRKHVESVHEGKKPFKCNICDASFSQKGDLNRHIASVHKENANIYHVVKLKVNFKQELVHAL
jgi:uncharacterized Zn-finger protein